ncbi:MAG: acetate--CoA ligase family protein, partial [Candidatus Eremiobacteraeota bacterium]|nr:acetate--CoA ligase family protein [Candidatus Eremiobacteraeota bacterium]
SVLVRIGAIAAAHPEIEELDVNPLLADEHGVLALDARIAVRAGGHAGVTAFAFPAAE